MNYQTADVDIIAETLRFNKKNGYPTAILVGAGMSVSAGIPAAGGIMKEIQKQFPRLAKRCVKKTYPAYMELLSPAQRRTLIGSFVDNARINMAHLYLGALVKENYVDRVLTTNFDPLVIRSLALFNLYPAVYDFAASQKFIAGEAAALSVFYLHGQRDGFVLLNTDEEVRRHEEKLENVFRDVSRRRCWIVIGYSGENDPVFKRLSEVEVFHNKLFWVGYRDVEPATHVLEGILQPSDKFGFYVKGHDADSFFLELVRKLKLAEPQIISRPFSHLKEAIESIADFSIDDRSVDMVKETKTWVASAIKGFEEGHGFADIAGAQKEAIDSDELIRKTREIWLSEKIDEIDALYDTVKQSGIEEARQNLAYALNDWGVNLGNLAKTKEGQEAEDLFKEAVEKFAKALEIKPDFHIAYNNWGTYLGNLAGQKAGREAEDLFKEAFDKYARALEIKPDFHIAYHNWGTYLGNLAGLKEGKDAEDLFKKAFEKYARALEIKPDNHDTYKNWGANLLRLAVKKEGREKEKWLGMAIEKLGEAEKIREGAGAYNLACVYSLKGDMEESLRWLEKSLKLSIAPPRKHIEQDTDLEPVRKNPRFNQLMDRYFKNP
jgi:tetratricopeptide (TPR) repeat protein